MEKYNLNQIVKNGYDVARKQVMPYVLATGIACFGFACDSGGSGGSSSNDNTDSTTTKQLVPISEISSNENLEDILGKSALSFANFNQSCKTILIEDTGNEYNIFPVELNGVENQGIYVTKLDINVEDEKIPYGVYNNCGKLSQTGYMANKRVPTLADLKVLVDKESSFPASESCDGYKNYINKLNYVPTTITTTTPTTPLTTTPSTPTTPTDTNGGGGDGDDF